MAHSHTHHHTHSVDVANINTAFVVGIVCNLLFVGVQVIVGFNIHSLSLLSDAGHNFADVASLALSLLALRMSKVKATDHYTYGYKKTSILVALLNAAVLLMTLGAIMYEAFHRFFNPETLPGLTISMVAGLGIVINTFSALLFFKEKDKDLNVKSAYLHLLSDALVSLGLVIGGVIIYYTHLTWIDPLLSIVVAIIILASTWGLLKNSLRLSLDGVPEGINIDEIKTKVQAIEGVLDFHHIHVWAISTTENALTGHLVVNHTIQNQDLSIIIDKLKHELTHLSIQHSTIETEFDDTPCEQATC